MKIRKLITTVLMFFFVVCAVSAYSSDNDSGALRNPDSTKRREDDLCGVIIRANVEAEVYINGKLFGKTPIATLDLGPSYFNLEIKKDGYDTIRCKIYPRKRYTYAYEFELKKCIGYINVKNAPSDSMIYVDSSRVYTFPLEVSPGSHTVKVRKFGYEDFSEYVHVENHETSNVNVRLQTAPFRISSFRVSRNSINPDYTSGIGKVNLSFEVTNDGSAVISVTDRYGNEVWGHNFNSFNTWSQSVTWDGTGTYGDRLPDGQYVVKLSGQGFDESRRITIDRTMIYPLSGFTPSGSGIGSLPCAFGDGVNYTKLFVDFGGIFAVDGDHFASQCFPVTAGLIIDFGKYNEIAGSIGSCITDKGQENPINASVSYKRNFTINLDSKVKLNFAGLVDYNFCSEYYFGALGLNMGTGLGVGLCAGLETKALYFGVTGEYSFADTKFRPTENATGIIYDSKDVLKYGVVASVLPWRNLKASAWTACYNNQALEAGADIIAMPGSGAFCCEAKASVITDFSNSNKNMFINARFGLSYLF